MTTGFSLGFMMSKRREIGWLFLSFVHLPLYDFVVSVN